jgi:DNA polymerase-3 subunit delta'
MLPQVVIVKNSEIFGDFLAEFKEKYKIRKFIEIKPLGKQITIDQIREIKKISVFNENKPFLILIYRFDLANLQAQNAFLKTLEEKADTKFIILTVENTNKLLPTIISRCQIIDLTKKDNEDKNLVSKKIVEIFKMAKNQTNLGFLSHSKISNITSERASLIIKDIINILRNTLYQKNNSASFLLKEGIKILRLLENNNCNPQLAIDNYLILINKVYNKNINDKKNNQ